ncbi:MULTISPECIES: hypothetical protein [unclassified Rhodococcus (in: high G+C Gram-positive bacteria)]|uniref:hypothetical protein n=3 Tax=Rhodococcus TaxID=1827 RepID=UPI001C9AE969|nr:MULTISPECIES: hypothetical protein [unclassified Rhodococcus (in: high G+C Gram-positive bacteria)]MBY6686558.1 hypothetical protein [Rhodococcus sp. BP-288]MBY6695268.1 hypothetical protein [Rhodococcus sp. BP-188]MBY6700050.1 hypothetical protein [Rhodococcus sp. BP-285]
MTATDTATATPMPVVELSGVETITTGTPQSACRTSVGRESDVPLPVSEPATLRVAARSRGVLIMLGSTAVWPLVNISATGFSVVCIAISGMYLMRWPTPRSFVPIVLVGLGSVGYAVSAAVNGTSPTNQTMLVFPAVALYIVGISVLASSLDEILALLAGISLGTVGFYVVLGTDLTTGGSLADIWKYGLAPPMTVLFLYVIASKTVRPWWSVLALTGLAGASVLLNYRSHALICVLAAVVVLCRGRRGPMSRVRTAVALAVAGIAFSVVITSLGANGTLGSKLQEKVELQATAHVSPLLAGRTEPPLSLTAIAARPLLGWGNADRIDSTTFAAARRFASELGFARSYPIEYLWRLPNGSVSLHSIILGSWAEGGVLAVLFPVWLLFAAVLLASGPLEAGRWMPLVITVGFQSAWDLAFSPWSYNLAAVCAVVACLAVRLTVRRRGVRVSAPPHISSRPSLTRPPRPHAPTPVEPVYTGRHRLLEESQ